MSPVVRRPIYTYVVAGIPDWPPNVMQPTLRRLSGRGLCARGALLLCRTAWRIVIIISYREYREYIYPAWTASYLQHNLVTPQICTMYELMNQRSLHIYSGKLSRVKTFAFFAVSEPTAKVFSAKVWGGEIHVGEFRNPHVAYGHMRVRCACARAKST